MYMYKSIKVLCHSQHFVFILGIVKIYLYSASAHYVQLGRFEQFCDRREQIKMFLMI